MSNYEKVKLAQAICVASTLLVLITNFNLLFLIIGLVMGWLFFCFGLAISLHKYSSHRTFEPRNKLIKYFLLWAGVQVTMGTPIDFAAGHRQHHVHSDTELDPYYLNHGLWHRIKLFFYWFPTSKISPLIIRDLLKDKDHTFINRHYWKILSVYPIVLLLIDPVWFGYFYAMPVVYVLLGMGYVTVTAHLPQFHKYGTVDNAIGDNSWNSKLFSIILAGEGLHNNHHASPGSYNYEKTIKDIDPSGRIIKYLRNSTL